MADSIQIFWEIWAIESEQCKKNRSLHFSVPTFLKATDLATQLFFVLENFQDLRIWKYEHEETNPNPKSLSPPKKKNMSMISSK